LLIYDERRINEMTIKLYDFNRSPNARKVRIALAEKGLKYEKVPVDLSQGEQRKPEFLKLNPYGRVPVLTDGDTAIYESTIINEYLEEKYPSPPLMPKDPGGKARARMMEDFCDSHFMVSMSPLVRQLLFTPENQRDQSVIDQSREEMRGHLKRLDRELEGKEYLAGTYSLADAAFTPSVFFLPVLGVEIDSSLKNVNAWLERLKARPSFEASA
jgi:glutathione S-transferase